jgi:hypothetical protein
MAQNLRTLSFLPLSRSAVGPYGEDMAIFLTITTLTLLALAVQRWGVDSRDGRDWQPRSNDWNLPRRPARRLPAHHAAVSRKALPSTPHPLAGGRARAATCEPAA